MENLTCQKHVTRHPTYQTESCRAKKQQIQFSLQLKKLQKPFWKNNAKAFDKHRTFLIDSGTMLKPDSAENICNSLFTLLIQVHLVPFCSVRHIMPGRKFKLHYRKWNDRNLHATSIFISFQHHSQQPVAGVDRSKIWQTHACANNKWYHTLSNKKAF